MDNEEVIGDQEINSNLIGLKKDDTPIWKNKKLLGIILTVLLLIMILIIIIIALSSNSNTNEEEDNSNKEKIGEINCIYDIRQTSEKTKLFGDNYEKRTSFDIFIGENKIKYSKDYKFDKAERTNVKLYYI